MTERPDLVAAVSAAVLQPDRLRRRLLQSIVVTARAIYAAQAASILLIDEATGELVFEAIAGQGESSLVGRRFPATRGIAGWVAAAREPVVVRGVTGNPGFARDVAESTGYVPETLMAAPLEVEDQALGVLEVLDPAAHTGPEGSELLALFAEQAAVALEVVRQGRTARRMVAEEGADLAELVTFVADLDGLSPERRAVGWELLRQLRRLMAG